MGIETFQYIDDLVDTNPTSTDSVSEGDNHIRGIKTTLKNTFPNVTGAITPTETELNYVDGVTSAIQTQLDAKQASATATQKTSSTGATILPVGTTAQRDVTPTAGYLRWNSTEGSAEVYDGTNWGSVGGGGAATTVYAEHANTLSENAEIASGNNAVSGGPITIDSGYSVTVPSGSVWTIV